MIGKTTECLDQAGFKKQVCQPFSFPSQWIPPLYFTQRHDGHAFLQLLLHRLINRTICQGDFYLRQFVSIKSP
jgi:hypothetical protein